MNPKGEICVEYFNYRVEFQMRGAGHIHGTLWINWLELEKNNNKEFDVKTVTEAFGNIKDEKFGNKAHKEQFDEPKNKLNPKDKPKSQFDKEHEALAAFIDKYCTCSLKDPRTRDIVRSVNMHPQRLVI